MQIGRAGVMVEIEPCKLMKNKPTADTLYEYIDTLHSVYNHLPGESFTAYGYQVIATCINSNEGNCNALKYMIYQRNPINCLDDNRAINDHASDGYLAEWM
ncbi:hypothetical protein RF11_16222 [Thelohanellus kitauei]|uniref:Uncharacterized protein n=1 Tax=Thelohanellus kitauei TaxID=669202 RepID=A0A0C2MYK9_THEKT|nr:hypothetical protein RF11_16222 [Thelohanellus kitauei]